MFEDEEKTIKNITLTACCGRCGKTLDVYGENYNEKYHELSFDVSYCKACSTEIEDDYETKLDKKDRLISELEAEITEKEEELLELNGKLERLTKIVEALSV